MKKVFVVTVADEIRSVWTSQSAAENYCANIEAETGKTATYKRVSLIRTPSFRR